MLELWSAKQSRVSERLCGQLILHSSRRIHINPSVILLVAVAQISACALSSSQNPPPPVKVAIVPATASAFLGQTKQLTATVTNTANTAVRWSVNGIAGGSAAVGTIATASPGADTAVYTAPQILPATASVTITATSQADSSASASATVQIQSDITVNIAPTSATAATSGNVFFSANVSGTGSPNIAVTWSVNGISGGNSSAGTIVSTAADAATYTAPAIAPVPSAVSVTATSVADPSKSATASVTISCAPSSSLSPSTASVQTGSAQAFSASLCAASGTSVTWDVNGVVGGNSTLGTITQSNSNASAATYAAPASVPTTDLVIIHASAAGQSASATVTIVGAPPVVVIVSPSIASIPVGQRASFMASVTGTSNANVTWAVNGVSNGNTVVGQVCAPSSSPCSPPTGTETSVDYVAPSTQPQANTVALTAASAANPMSTGGAQITITPPPSVTVSVAPFYTFLDASQQFQFVAAVSGSTNQAVTWSVSSAVPGQGCSGTSCGTIDNSGNYTAPAAAPSPNAISVVATSAANSSASATATVALLSGPVIETVLPSSVFAGAANSFLLAVQGLNFVPTMSSSSSLLLINGLPRTTNCPIAGRCTTTLTPSDVASAGVISVQIENPGVVPALSNPVSVVVLASEISPGMISLSVSAPVAASANLVVTEPTTAGATPSPVNVDFAGPMSPDGSTCTIQGAPIIVTRPTSGTATVSICVHGNFLDPAFNYTFTSPSTGGDIGVVPSALSGLFPNLIELTLTVSSSTVPGVRTLFITTPNGDVAAASGLLEVK